jgi:hypothetical protein
VVERGDTPPVGAVFSVGWSVYNRVLRKKLIGLFCGDCEGRPIEYLVVGSSSSFYNRIFFSY